MVPANGGIPNHPAWPALLVRSAVAPDQIEETFLANGWRGTWRWSVYDYHHFHPASHEVLGVAAGSAVIHVGGPDGPQLDVQAGDVMILPAGVGHKRVSASSDFAVIGAYPPGQESPEICRADPASVVQMVARVAEVPRPDCPLGRRLTDDSWT
ncbi:cupin domain-containing protein [Pelagovum pacificum]|uniref:Cupin domain-containing protein n=2 Tax=Pelagovum pacificum TaxID=2588711 RepID=A0A5C5GKM7_9RHOB|nr:cupin domain-containing protein [Pelagovum pacificum]TNY34341.1 cupin domain-containing protein [Pelagovum pacificum]